jgi:serine phosphatase RsbU (regulator of sigma subunit)
MYPMVRELGRRLREADNATIRDLQHKNHELAQAYEQLQATQAQLIESHVAQERIEHELRIARGIQQAFLPKETPTLPGWELIASYEPARVVGGDFYDFLALPDGRVGLIIGDATDKGLPAALIMANARSVVRAAAAQLLAPGELLQRVNDLLCPGIPPGMFVTCLYAILEPATGRLRYANTGHDVPFRRTDAEVVELWATGMPLGLMPGMIYDEAEVVLTPGEMVLFYSDGLIEARNPRREMLGLPQLRRLLWDQRAGDGSSLVDFLRSELARFTGPAWEQEDDITLVVLQRAREVAHA